MDNLQKVHEMPLIRTKPKEGLKKKGSQGVHREWHWLANTKIFTTTLGCRTPFSIFATYCGISWHVICSFISLQTWILNCIFRHEHGFVCVANQNAPWCFTWFCRIKQSQCIYLSRNTALCKHHSCRHIWNINNSRLSEYFCRICIIVTYYLLH